VSVTDSLRDVIVREMGVGMRINCGTLELRIPCSTTELLAQTLPRVYSRTTLSSTWEPASVALRTRAYAYSGKSLQVGRAGLLPKPAHELWALP
jgi:hypothetical protein